MVVSRSHTPTSRHRRAIGTFPNRRIATQALHELRDSNFPMERISVITRDRDHKGKLADIAQETKADDGAALGAAAGGALGTLTGLLVGLGSLAIPGVGPVMLAGATATTLATTLAGTAIGAVAGSLLGGLIGLGIPEEEARDYHDRILKGEYLVIVEGTDSEIAQAEYILQRRGIAAYRIYDMPTSRAEVAKPIEMTPVIQHNSGQAPQAFPRPIQQYDTVDVGRSKHGIATFPNDQAAGVAIATLTQSAFPTTHVSVITRRVEHPEMFMGIDLRDRFETARYGVPVDHAQIYDEQLNRGDCLLIISGGERELQYAEKILAVSGVSSWQVYDPMMIRSTTPVLNKPPSIEHPPAVNPTVEPAVAAKSAPPKHSTGANKKVSSQRVIPTVEVIHTTTTPTPTAADGRDRPSSTQKSGIDGSASSCDEGSDRSQTTKKVITSMPDVIMVDHRNQAN